MGPRVALVIGSGGLKCAASVGLWRVLEREGIAPDLAVGSSGGAIYAAALALGRTLDEAEQLTALISGGLFSLSVHGVARAVFPRLLGYDASVGLGDDARVSSVIHSIFGDARFEDTRIPLFIAATDALTGERVLLSEGRIADAIRASVSLPLILPPVRLNGRWLVDGGLSNPLPIDAAVREGCDLILAMGFENTCHSEIRTFGDSLQNVTATPVNHLIRSTFAFYSLAHHAEVIPILPEFEVSIGFADTHLLPYIIEQGVRSAEEQVPYLRRLFSTAASA